MVQLYGTIMTRYYVVDSVVQLYRTMMTPYYVLTGGQCGSVIRNDDDSAL